MNCFCYFLLLIVILLFCRLLLISLILTQAHNPGFTRSKRHSNQSGLIAVSNYTKHSLKIFEIYVKREKCKLHENRWLTFIDLCINDLLVSTSLYNLKKSYLTHLILFITNLVWFKLNLFKFYKNNCIYYYSCRLYLHGMHVFAHIIDFMYYI